MKCFDVTKSEANKHKILDRNDQKILYIIKFQFRDFNDDNVKNEVDLKNNMM